MVFPSELKQPLGVLLASASALFACFVFGAATGVASDVIRQVGGVDPALIDLPFFGAWPVVLPIALAGVWAGLDLALDPHERRLAAMIPSVAMAGGLALFAYGLWLGHHDCTSGSRDGLCWLAGSLLCSCSVVVLVLGSLAVALQTALRTRQAEDLT